MNAIKFRLAATGALLGAGLAVMAMPATPVAPRQAVSKTAATPDTTQHYIKKVLAIGDSMTGWMAERLNAYGEINGFDVATVVWDGSTISKWGSTPRLKEIIDEQKPDLIVVSLGMNELFEPKPDSRLDAPVSRILEAVGKTPLLWVGPPSWPGKDKGARLNDWLASRLGAGRFFRSFDLDIPRQSSTNPHPSRQGMEQWVDSMVKWIPGNTALRFRSLDAPASGKMSRGKTFIYRRLKEQL